jgi:hypothetical protein
VEIVLDPDNEYVRFLDGDTTFSATFHKGGTIFGLLDIGLTVTVVFLIVAIFLTYANRGKRKKK